MFRSFIAIFLNILLMVLLTVPSIIIAIDNSADTSIFYSLAEEEEPNKIKLKTNDRFVIVANLNTLESNEGIEYYLKKYPKPHLNLIFTPPEFLS